MFVFDVYDRKQIFLVKKYLIYSYIGFRNIVTLSILTSRTNLIDGTLDLFLFET